MTKYVKINEELDIKYNKQIKEYLSPDYLYIPYNEKDELLIKNKNVYKNDLLIKNNCNIYSPVSGIILGLCDNIVDGKKQKTIVIENNFEENTRKFIKQNIDIYSFSKNDFLSKIKEYGNYNLKGNILVVNGIDYEPYEEAYSYLLSEQTDTILEGIDVIYNILDLDKCYLAIKNNDSLNVETLLNQIGTYPNIELKLLEDIYPIGHKDLLIKELIPSDNLRVIYLTVEDVYNIYNIIKRNIPITYKYITVTGNALNKSKVMKVKLGTRLADIINDEFKIVNDNYDVVVNGLLSGYNTNSLNTIVTPNIRSIFINNKSVINSNKCINCGLCHLNCPLKCDPRTKYKMDKCIKCGLCNYICPSKIRLVGDEDE